MTLETLFKISIFRENLQAGEIFTQLQPLDNICTFLEEEVTSFFSDIAQWHADLPSLPVSLGDSRFVVSSPALPVSHRILTVNELAAQYSDIQKTFFNFCVSLFNAT